MPFILKILGKIAPTDGAGIPLQGAALPPGVRDGVVGRVGQARHRLITS